MVFEKTFPAEAPLTEIYAYIDQVLDGTGGALPQGIQVSNGILNKGIDGERRGIRIAMNPEIYPEDRVRLIYPQF